MKTHPAALARPGEAARLPHDAAAWARLRVPSVEDPLRVLVSGCLEGWPCAVDGSDYGLGGAVAAVLDRPEVRRVPFCPEDVGFGTPRLTPDLDGGDGRDVLAGRARVIGPDGEDLTEPMLRGAHAMLAAALEARVELAVLTDMSAACGSQVISLGHRSRPVRRFQIGVGVATALLLAHGVPVLSQRDHRSLERLRHHLDPDHRPDPEARDHHEGDWYRQSFLADL